MYEENNILNTVNINYKCKEAYIDELNDLAILKADIEVKLNYSKIVTQNIKIGEEVYIAGNPNYNYRSIVKGIVSNKSRYTIGNSSMWQMSGGITSGSSGGGAFTMDGELIALAKSIDARQTDFCSNVEYSDTDVLNCVIETIPYIGYFIPPKVIKKFLLSTKFKDKFDYLK